MEKPWRALTRPLVPNLSALMESLSRSIIGLSVNPTSDFKNPKFVVELLLRETPEPMLDTVSFGISGGTPESSEQLQDRDINRAVAIVLLRLRVHWPVKRFHVKAKKSNSFVSKVLNARKNAGDGQTGLQGLRVLNGVAPKERCHRFLHLFRQFTENVRGLEVNISSIERLMVKLGGDEESDSAKLETIIQKIATKAGWELADYNFDHPPAAKSSSADGQPPVPTSDGGKESIRADLRAKMHRAQELHGRDEGKEAIGLLEEVFHAAQAHGLKQEQLEAILNLGFATSARRDFKAVERRLREAEKLIPDVDGEWFQIQYKRLKARVLLHNKYPEPAENFLKRAIALGESGGKDKNIEKVALLARASYVHLLSEQKRASEADEHMIRMRSVIEAANEDQDLGLIAEVLEACIHWAAAKGDKEQAVSFVKIALERGAGGEAATCFGHSLHDCANGARGMKATEIALACAEAAERLGHVAERPDMAFAAAYTAAAVLIDKEDFHAVRERCVRLLDVAKTLPEPKLRFALFHLLSLASRQLGDKTTAVDAAETALRDCEGDVTGVCMAKMALAEALRDSGRVKDALEHARTALQLSEHADVPPEWVETNLVLIADCAARLGDWATAESHAEQLGKRSPSSGSKDRRMLVENRIRMHKMLREGLTSVINATEPLSLARTEGALSVQAANAVLVRGILEGWKHYPNAAAAMYDYWGRGNLTRAMLNMRAFPNALNITLEVHTIDEARRAIRLWGLIADVLVLIWKGPTVSNRVYCPVTDSFTNAGGGGYIAALVKGIPRDPKSATGMKMWEHDESADGTTPIIGVSHASLLPPEVGRFLCEDAVHLIALGRLIVVPATGIGCVGTGHGPVEALFAEACNAIPAIKGDAARFPASWLPYFHDIPLNALAHVVQEFDEPLRRLRILLMRKARQFQSSGTTGTEAKELELELQDSIAEITDAHAGLRQKHGWGEAQEAVLSRQDGFTGESIAPILVLQNMGYRWRIERANTDSAAETQMIPKANEPILTWLHPPDTKPKFITQDDMPDTRRKRK